jgi:uncharacterized membrane protein HdeD (DUF308 family)
METDKKKISPTAFKLGLAGLIPFVVLAGSSFAIPSSYKDLILLCMLAYAASISSFLGAVHWGLTMRDANPNRMYLIWGVIPSLIAWISLMLRPDLGLWLITTLLWVCLIIDAKIYPSYGLRHWLPMRLFLTTTASVACLIVSL